MIGLFYGKTSRNEVLCSCSTIFVKTFFYIKFKKKQNLRYLMHVFMYFFFPFWLLTDFSPKQRLATIN